MGARVDQLMKAIYSFQPDEEAWLKRIVEAVEPLQLSGGVIAYTSSLGAKTSLRTLVNHSETSSEDVRTNATFTPPPIFRRLHAPMPLSHSARLFPQVLSEFGLDYERFLPSVPYPMPPAMWGLSGGDAGVESALITFLCRSGEEFHPRERRTLDAVGAHLSSALRLRCFVVRSSRATTSSTPSWRRMGGCSTRGTSYAKNRYAHRSSMRFGGTSARLYGAPTPKSASTCGRLSSSAAGRSSRRSSVMESG